MSGNAAASRPGVSKLVSLPTAMCMEHLAGLARNNLLVVGITPHTVCCTKLNFLSRLLLRNKDSNSLFVPSGGGKIRRGVGRGAGDPAGAPRSLLGSGQ